MKIVQIGGDLSGAQRSIEEAIHNYLQNQGHDSYIFFARGNATKNGEICYERRIENILTRGLRKLLGKYGAFSTLQTYRLIRYLSRIKPDVVHLHVLHHGYTNFGMLFRYLAKNNMPIVYTMHDMWAFTGGCYHYVAYRCDGYRTKCIGCPAAKERLDCEKKYTSKALLQKQELLMKLGKLHLVTVSQWVEREVKNGFLAKVPTTVIYNGVDYPNVENISLQKEDGKIHLVSIAASWSEKKGIHILLKLAELLGERFQVHLVGNADDLIRRKATPNVKFYGYCSDRIRVFSIIASADLLISASLEETFGMTVVEAALMGVRSIGFSSTAVKEALKLVAGVEVKEHTSHALRNAIIDTIANNKCRLSDDEINKVKRFFSIDGMVQRYYELYESLLNA